MKRIRYSTYTRQQGETKQKTNNTIRQNMETFKGSMVQQDQFLLLDSNTLSLSLSLSHTSTHTHTHILLTHLIKLTAVTDTTETGETPVSCQHLTYHLMLRALLKHKLKAKHLICILLIHLEADLAQISQVKGETPDLISILLTHLIKLRALLKYHKLKAKHLI